MKKILRWVLYLLLLLVIVIAFNTIRFSSRQLRPPAEKGNILQKDTSAISHLSAAIQFRTVSYNHGKTDSSSFTDFHNFLRATYPKVFASLEIITINNYSLLLHWKGKDSNAQPVILYAHMDVVPVDSATWKKSPFQGEVDNENIYGRGAVDDKAGVISILEASEKLLSQNFIPSGDLYFAFGHDEEIGGLQGAAEIAKYLQQNKIHAEFLLDEGGLVAVKMVPFVSHPVALVAIAEKGYLSLELSVEGKSGHSSLPPKETPVDILASAINKIHDHPFEKRMTIPLSDFISYTGPEMAMPFKALFANSWLFNGIIFNEYEKIPGGNAMIRTTSVATMVSGGIKENIIPPVAAVTFNFRILPGDSSSGIVSKIKSIIDDERIVLKVLRNPDEASPVSSSETNGFKIIHKTINEVFPDVVVTPTLLIGATDSKHFRNVTDNIYRFLPIRMNDEILGGMHGKDEKISINSFMESIQFYKKMIEKL
jgi:carboxypeptidase PM20D1